MAPKIASQPAMIPYRTATGEIYYASTAPAVTTPTSLAAETSYFSSDYDSDSNMPLIPVTDLSPPPPAHTILSADAVQHFTASGKPMPIFKSSGILSIAYGDSMYGVPQLLPQRYTDESIIPAIITGVMKGDGAIERAGGADFGIGGFESYPVESGEKTSTKHKRRSSLMMKLRGKGEKSEKEKEREKKEGITKVVYMPRGDYLKWFAKSDGVHSGTEPYRRWSETELEETFGKYRPKKEEKTTGYRPPL